MMAAADPPDEQRLTPKGRATRERIVEAAAELILTDGFSAFNMDRVRKAAAVSGSQMAHYFVDKQALIRAILVRQIDVVLDFHRSSQLHGLESFDDFEHWIDLNMRYLRRIGYEGTPTFHALVGRLAKSGGPTRQTLGEAYWQWVALLEQGLQRMKEHGALVADAEPRRLAMVIVCLHQGGGTVAYAYRQEWAHADAVRFAVNYLRTFATDPAERAPHPARRRRVAKVAQIGDDAVHFTRKGIETRARIIDAAAELMFRHGVAGTSMEDLRSAASVSGSQISHYFQDKRELTRLVIAARLDDLIAFHTRPEFGALADLGSLQAWARACAADAETVYRRGGCSYGSLAGELLEADDDVLDVVTAGYDQWLALFRDGLLTMCEAGELRSDADPRHLAVALAVAHQGGAMVAHATNDAEPMRAAVMAAADYVRSFGTKS
jgi:AcrR family transcriptional regulator